MIGETPVPPGGVTGEAATGSGPHGPVAAQDPVALVADLVSATRLIRLGRDADAWLLLLPTALDPGELRQRAHTMVAVAALVTGALTAPGEPCVYRPAAKAATEGLAGELSAAGVGLDAAALRRLIAERCAASEGVDPVLMDVLHVLVARFAVLSSRAPVPDLRPAVGRAAPSTSAPGGRPVPSELEELAVLLAEVVELAEAGGQWPNRLEVLADHAREHASVRRALEARS